MQDLDSLAHHAHNPRRDPVSSMNPRRDYNRCYKNSRNRNRRT